MSPALGIAIAFVLILVNGLFVAAEFALITARRTRIEAKAAEGDRRSKSALAAMADLPLMLSGAQLGITLSSLGLGRVAEPAIADLLEPLLAGSLAVPEGLVHGISLAIALVIVVFFHMVLGEMLPKNLALAEAESTLLWVVPAHRAFVQVFRPLIWVLNAMSQLLLKPFGVSQVKELGTAHTAQELVTLIDASRGVGLIDDFRHNLLSGALDFRDSDAASLMIPWESVVTVPNRATVAEISQVTAASGHSRLPIVVDDAVLGFVHAKDLAFVDDDLWNEPLDRRLIRAMLVTAPDRGVEDLLFAMRSSQVHLAVVREGKTSLGIVTLEDILESIVGEIIDETDRIRGLERVR